MTQEPPQSWPPREPGRSGTRPLAVDPITGELIETDVPPGGEFWVPAGGSAPAGTAAHPPTDPPPTAAWYPGQAPAEPPPAHPAPGYPLPAYPPAAYGPPPTGAPPYGYPGAPAWGPPYAGPQVRPTNGLAVASLVLGVVWLFWIGSVLALVFGYIARSQIRRTGESGDGLAIAGLVLGWVGIAFLAIGIVGSVLSPS